MLATRHVLLVALLVWLATVVQGRAAHAVSIHGAQPDFPLIVLSCGALLLGSVPGTLLGFWTGLLTAVSLPMAYGSLFVSRIAAGAFAGGFGRSLIRDNFIVPPLVVLAATLIAELMTAVMAPGFALHHIRRWLWLLGGELIYNTLLALPVSMLLRLCQVGRVDADPFGRLP